MLVDTNRKKRSYWLAALLGAVAIGIYVVFIWMTARSSG
jgi:hypothetical protein